MPLPVGPELLESHVKDDVKHRDDQRPHVPTPAGPGVAGNGRRDQRDGVVHKDDTIILRIKDECVPFDPSERLSQADSEDRLKNAGIRLVFRMAKDFQYQNVLGMNVLTICMGARQERGDGHAAAAPDERDVACPTPPWAGAR